MVIQMIHTMSFMIQTERLILRAWKKEDTDAYFQINQDHKVTEFLGEPLTMQQVHDFIAAANNHQDKYHYTLWASCLKKTDELIGFIGLNYTDLGLSFTPAVEIAWRLGSQYWDKGYGTEGARAALHYGFIQCGLKEIISFTAHSNVRSLRVMEKIGLKRDFNGDFAHPKLASNHKLSSHVLYRLYAGDYIKQGQYTL